MGGGLTKEGPPIGSNSWGLQILSETGCQSSERNFPGLSTPTTQLSPCWCLPTGQPQLYASCMYAKEAGDAVYKFLRLRTGQRGAENGSWRLRGARGEPTHLSSPREPLIFQVPPTPPHNMVPFVDYNTYYEALWNTYILWSSKCPHEVSAMTYPTPF